MPEPIRLADYRPPTFAVDTVDLRFELDPEATRVTSRLAVRRQAEGELTLYGSELELHALRVDGRPLAAGEYAIDGETMVIPGVSETTIVEVETGIAPERNSALEGLYRSSGMYCTSARPK